MTRSTLLLGLALALLCGCPGPAGPKQDALDIATERGKLVICMNASYDPFEVMGDDGKPVGFDVDFANEVAKDLKLPLEIKNVKWDGIIGILRTGKADAIFSGMSVTEDRKQVVLFSDPYFEVGQVVVKRKGDDRFKTHTDLNDPKFTIAIEQATTGEQACKKSIPKATLLRFEKVTEACVAVQQEKADAVVFDNAMLLKYVSTKASDKLEGLWTPFTSEQIAVAVRQDSPKLQAAVNKTLARLKASGQLDKMLVKHFGEGAVQKKSPSVTRSTQRRLVRYLVYAVVLGAFIGLALSGKQALDRTYTWDWSTFFEKGFPLLTKGLWFTVLVAALSLCIALPLGVFIGLCRTARDPGARFVGFIYVEILRGTPLLVQVMLWYYVIGEVFGGLNSFQAAVCALSCFTASYIAEIVRAGIQSIDRGQMEAARSLGLTHAQAMRKIILPQALRRVLPPLASEFIALVKDSSLASVIGYEELTKRAQDVQGTHFLTFEVWIIVAFLYLAINVLLSLGVRGLEWKLGTQSKRGEIR